MSYLKALVESVREVENEGPDFEVRNQTRDVFGITDSVLCWKVADLVDDDLLVETLSEIPQVFESSDHWARTLYPFVLEELRAQIAAVFTDDILTIPNYEIFAQKIEEKDDSVITLVVTYDGDKQPNAIKDFSTSYSTFALMVNRKESLQSVEDFLSPEHVLCHIGVPVMKIDSTTNERVIDPTLLHISFMVSNRTQAFVNSAIPDAQVSSGFLPWKVYLLNIPSSPSSRISQALSSADRPAFMSDILQANPLSSHSMHHTDLIHTDMMDLTIYKNKLNESQIEAIRSVLECSQVGKTKIQLIKGPPGTGKTNTLVSLIDSLYAHNKIVHVTAPTNAAIKELFMRSVSSITHTPKKFLLIGNINRLDLDLSDNDFFIRYHYETRVENIQKAAKVVTITIMEIQTLLRGRQVKSSNEFKQVINDYMTKLLYAIDELVAEGPDTYSLRFNQQQINKMLTIYRVIYETESYIIKNWLNRIESSKCNLFDDLIRTLLHAISSFHLIEIKKKELMKSIFLEAQIIFSTVNSSGKKIFDFKTMEIIIIDEATQLVQAETAIILKSYMKCLVLAGDDKQLPSTVISKLAAQLGYGVSLFDRLIRHHYPYNLLNIQYRMHPSIAYWPNIQFYQGKLMNGPNVMNEKYTKTWHIHFPVVTLCDVSICNESMTGSGSKYNLGEIMVIQRLITHIRSYIQNEVLTIGILSPYSEQIRLLSHLTCMNKDGISIKVSTIDGYQGQESDIIIFTTVRSNINQVIGFLNDERRLNVAITRARYSLLVVGNTRTLSNHTLWKEFIQYCRSYGTYYNNTNYKIIQQSEQKYIKEQNTLIDILQPSSAYLQNAIWNLALNHECKLNIPKAPKNIRMELIKKILDLANGIHPILKRHTMNIHSDYIDIIQAYEIGSPPNQYILLWYISLQKTENTYKQFLVLWDMLPMKDIKQLTRTLFRVQSKLHEFSSDALDRCKFIQRNGRLRIPYIWYDPSNTFIMRSTISNNSSLNMMGGGRGELEDSQIENSSALTKFYEMNDIALKLLLQGNKEIDLPFVMSEDEQLIVNHSGSMFILGRSGTGKTTCMLRRMFIQSMRSTITDDTNIKGLKYEANSLKKMSGVGNQTDVTVSVTTSNTATNILCRQMMVTASPVLCDAIRKSYNKMCYSVHMATQPSSSLSSSSPSLNEIENHTYQDRITPRYTYTSITKLTDQDFPLIITFQDFIHMLDYDLSHSFYQYHSTIHSHEVDYYRFNQYYYPRMDEKLCRDIDSSMLYTEIMSYIKGSSMALKSIKGELSLEEYIKLAYLRENTINIEKRKRIYDAYIKYEKLKNIEYCDYDMMDVVHHIYQALSTTTTTTSATTASITSTTTTTATTTTTSLSTTITHIFIDEVQDLSPAQIMLFKFICNNANGYVLAGDTAQTIAHGVGFRFQTVKDIFYEEIYNNNNNNNNSSDMPPLYHLQQNFRTHSGVINLANSIVDLITYFFPTTIDKLSPEISRVHGNPPIFIESVDDMITDLFHNSNLNLNSNNKENNQLNSCEFGAEQCILVRDEIMKQSVLQACNHNALVLTVLESKGMEFTDCLVYNFFKTSELKNLWRLLYECIHNSSESRPQFDNQKHILLCSELKNLYVLITRTRQRLLIFDSDLIHRKPILDYWKHLSLIKIQPLDDTIRSMFTNNSTPEEWRDKAIQFRDRKQYENAKFCFEKAGDDTNKRLCHAAELEQKAENVVGDSNSISVIKSRKDFYEQAAEIYNNFPTRRYDYARCLKGCQKYNDAGDIYSELLQYSNAAICYELGLLWMKAAYAYNTIDDIDKALKCVYKENNYEVANQFIAQYESRSHSTSTSKLMELKTVYSRNGADYSMKIKDYTMMIEYINQFPNIELKRDYLIRNHMKQYLLNIELYERNYDKVSDIYEKQMKFLEAANYYEQYFIHLEGSGHHDYTIYVEKTVQNLLRHIRLLHLTDDYTMNVLNATSEECLIRAMEIVKKSYTLHSDEKLQFELSYLNLYSCSERNTVMSSTADHINLLFELDKNMIAYDRIHGLYSTWYSQVLCYCTIIKLSTDWKIIDKIYIKLFHCFDKAKSIINSNKSESKLLYSEFEKHIIWDILHFFELYYIQQNDIPNDLFVPINIHIQQVFGQSNKIIYKDFIQKATSFFDSILTSYKNKSIEILSSNYQNILTTSKSTEYHTNTENKWEILQVLYNKLGYTMPHFSIVKNMIILTSEQVCYYIYQLNMNISPYIENSTFISSIIRPSEESQSLLRYLITSLINVVHVNTDISLEYERLSNILSINDLLYYKIDLSYYKKTSDIRFTEYQKENNVSGLIMKDTRCRLLYAYFIQINHHFANNVTTVWPQNRLLLAAKHMAECIIDDYFICGSVYSILQPNQRSASTLLHAYNMIQSKDGCFSLTSYIQIIDKAFMILLLFMKKGKDIYCIEYMLLDIITRPCYAYSEAIKDLMDGVGILQSKDDRYKYNNDPDIILAKFIDGIINMLSHLTRERLKHWKSVSRSIIPMDSAYFIQRIVIVLLTYLANISTKNPSTYTSKISALLNNTTLAIHECPQSYLSVLKSICQKSPIVSTIAKLSINCGHSFIVTTCIQEYDIFVIESIMNKHSNYSPDIPSFLISVDTNQRVVICKTKDIFDNMMIKDSSVLTTDVESTDHITPIVDLEASRTLLSSLKVSTNEFIPQSQSVLKLNDIKIDMMKEQYNNVLNELSSLWSDLTNEETTLEHHIIRQFEKEFWVLGYHPKHSIVKTYIQMFITLAVSANNCMESLSQLTPEDREEIINEPCIMELRHMIEVMNHPIIQTTTNMLQLQHKVQLTLNEFQNHSMIQAKLLLVHQHQVDQELKDKAKAARKESKAKAKVSKNKRKGKK